MILVSHARVEHGHCIWIALVVLPLSLLLFELQAPVTLGAKTPVRSTKLRGALSRGFFVHSVKNRGLLLEFNRLREIAFPLVRRGQDPSREAVLAIHLQHFAPAFDSDVVFPPGEHGSQSERV